MTTLGFALLGLLAREPLSGYDLAQQLKKPVGFFWHARHSQIYPELALLEAEGLVTHRVIDQTDRPDKKLYEITGQGRQVVGDWVTSPLPVPAVRDELVLRAYCVWLADRGRARAMFEEQARIHAGSLAHYEAIKAWFEADHHEQIRDITSPHFAGYAAVMRGVGYEREYTEWCRWVVTMLAAE
jgi:DNA-binding PadR family transcriptional regulator